MSCSGDDVFLCSHLGRRLHGHIGLALIIEYHKFVLILRFRVSVAESHGKIGRIAASQSVDGDAAGERPDEADLDLVLRLCGHNSHEPQRCQNDRRSPQCPVHCSSLQQLHRGMHAACCKLDSCDLKSGGDCTICFPGSRRNFGPGANHFGYVDRPAKVSARTSVPRVISSMDAYSSGRWLYPLRHGMNSMAAGAIRAMKSVSR